jgi:outer membrane protein OmpA-like peptidoglycan-associated protein
MQQIVSKTFFIKTIVASTLILTVACERELGAELDEGQFGNPTMNNFLVQTGQLDYAVNLSRRFAEETPATINFDFNSAKLDDNSRAALREQAKWIAQFPEIQFKVYGHTDLVGSSGYNKSLGLRRARAAVNYLVSQGINRSRLAAVVSYGKSQPVVDTASRERRNRRTVTEVSGFVQNHPTVLNGKYAEIVFRDYVDSAVVKTELTGTEDASGG